MGSRDSEDRTWGETTQKWSAAHALFNRFHPKQENAGLTSSRSDTYKALYTAKAHTNIFGQTSFQVHTENKDFAEQLTDFSFSATPSLSKQLTQTLTEYYVQLLKEEQYGRTTSLAQKKSAILRNLQATEISKTVYFKYVLTPNKCTDTEKNEGRAARKQLGLIDKLELFKEKERAVFKIKNVDERIHEQEKLRRLFVTEIVEGLKQNGKITKAFWHTDGRLYKVLRNAQYIAKQYQFTAAKLYRADQGIFKAKQDRIYAINSALAVGLPHNIEESEQEHRTKKAKQSDTKKEAKASDQADPEDSEKTSKADIRAQYQKAKPYSGNQAAYLAQAKRLALAISAAEHAATPKPLFVVNQISRPFDKLEKFFKNFFKTHILPDSERENWENKSLAKHIHKILLILNGNISAENQIPVQPLTELLKIGSAFSVDGNGTIKKDFYLKKLVCAYKALVDLKNDKEASVSLTNLADYEETPEKKKYLIKKINQAIASLTREYEKEKTKQDVHKTHTNTPYHNFVKSFEQGEGFLFKAGHFFRLMASVTILSMQALVMGLYYAPTTVIAWIAGNFIDAFADFPEGWIAGIIKNVAPEQYLKILLRHDKRPLIDSETVEARVANDTSSTESVSIAAKIKWLHAKQPYAPKTAQDASLPTYLLKSTEYLTLASIDWMWQNPITTMVAATMGSLGYLSCINPSWPLHQQMVAFGKWFFASTTEGVTWSASTAAQVGIMGVNLLENPADSYTMMILKVMLRHPLELAAIAGISYGLGFALGRIEFIAAEFGTQPILAQSYLGAKSTTLIAETAMEREKSLVAKTLIFPLTLIIGPTRLLFALMGLGSIKRETLNIAASLMRGSQFLIETLVTSLYLTTYIATAALLFPFNAIPKLAAKIFGSLPFVGQYCDPLIDLQFNTECLFENITGKIFEWKESVLRPLDTSLFNAELRLAATYLQARDNARDEVRASLRKRLVKDTDAIPNVGRPKGTTAIEESKLLTYDCTAQIQDDVEEEHAGMQPLSRRMQQKKENNFAKRIQAQTEASELLQSPDISKDLSARWHLGFNRFMTGKISKRIMVPESGIRTRLSQ